jgi:hypothetical protein
MITRNALAILITCVIGIASFGQHGNKFEPLGTLLPTPNEYRTASGAPGSRYWQQRVDYNIKCELDEKNLALSGNETITYFNNSPDNLDYLWLQLDENIYSKKHNANYQYSNGVPLQMSESDLKKWEEQKADRGYGVNIISITDARGRKLKHIINRTMMRIDLPLTIKSKERYSFHIAWNFKITNRMEFFGRGGYEHFGDGNNLYTITHWYPRLCLYSDYGGWHNQQYVNKEFALSFGNFNVQITVPSDHIVGATGECQNYTQVLTSMQLLRLEKAKNASQPVDIVTLDEAKANEGSRSNGKKTWVFKAENVRDFAWTASRKFIWDGMAVNINGKRILCMSYYGKEAYPVYHPYSTKLIAHTLRFYSNYTIPYPYPVAQSVEASNGIEFPMISFNLGRAKPDGTVTEEIVNSVIHVVIHEVGHNWFPMIINNDERQWAWMDEGVNTFVQYLAEQAWDSTFPSTAGPAKYIVPFMRTPKDEQEAIMTMPDNALQYSATSYLKPATALNILRETVMGRDRFDTAFKRFTQRWEFRHPTPADFFRTMEDASADDLDWFWRGWFYGTDACDISIDTVRYLTAGDNKFFYQVEMSNKGGLVMPVIIEWTFDDGTKEIEYIPAQIWRHNEGRATKSYMKDKKVISIMLDPKQETADIDESNNTWKRFGAPRPIKIQ